MFSRFSELSCWKNPKNLSWFTGLLDGVEFYVPVKNITLISVHYQPQMKWQFLCVQGNVQGESSLACHASHDTGHRFIRSLPKDSWISFLIIECLAKKITTFFKVLCQTRSWFEPTVFPTKEFTCMNKCLPLHLDSYECYLGVQLM